MNCEDFGDVVLGLARGQMLEARERDGALDHAADCARCQLRLEDEQRVSSHLRALAQAMKPLEAGQLIERQVLAAFRSRRTIVSLPFRAQRRKYWTAAAAAVVLVLGAVLIIQRTHSVRLRENLAATPTEKMETAWPIPENEPRDVPDASTRDRQLTVASKPKAVPRYSVASRSSNRDPEARSSVNSGNTNSEIATDFFPIGDTSALSLADGGHLVRVQLPRSALMRFGLPVNADRVHERVKADVLLGSDGMARAIRFVR